MKANQVNLLTRLQAEARAQKPLSEHQCRQKNRGRLEHRHCQLFVAPQDWHKHYKGIACFVVLRRWGYRKGKRFQKAKPYEKTHYYILSCPMESAGQAACLIRNHWLIENRLHWVKDVLMKEDKNRIRHHQAAKNVSLIKNIVLNLTRATGFTSLKTAIERYAHDIKGLYSLLL